MRDTGRWQTPGGNTATFVYRTDTTDWNTISSCNTANEYGIPQGASGWALDIGAHVGGLTIALGLDNPDMRIIAVEPIPENLELLRLNAAMNGLTDRVTVLDGAVGRGAIHYGFSGSEVAEGHRYIGNLTGIAGSPETVVEARVYSLRELVDMAGGTIRFAKIDCEGGEWWMLPSPAAAAVEEWVGEWHQVFGNTRDAVADLFGDGFNTWVGQGIGGGAFKAWRKS